jgi:hypothetical protein
MTALAQTKIIFKKKGSTKIKFAKKKNEEALPLLWKVIKQGREQHNMMGCSAFGGTEHEVTMDDVACGILSGHAYSIIDAFDLDVKMEEEDDNGQT